MNMPPDRRLIPARPDLAAAALAGTVEAERYVPGIARSVIEPSAALRREPRPDARLDTEALQGEAVTVYDEAEGWAWVQLACDRYVGYMPAHAIGPAAEPDHRIACMRSFIYPGPDMKLPPRTVLPFGAACRVGRWEGRFAEIADGFVWADHLVSLDHRVVDFVAVAETFLGVPYLWGGRTSLGLDCSALVQTALAAAGLRAPRDSDQQAAGLGTALPEAEPRRRGDLVFWPGHVGIMQNRTDLLHANGHAMLVTSEPLAVAAARIRAATGHEIATTKRVALSREA